jgi:hypothetical protein
MSMFLTAEEVAELTGKRRKSLQVEELRLMGIAFYVNGSGRPIVCRTALEGKQQEEKPVKKRWQPNFNHG